jgi:general secretion pathway protein L
MMFETGVGIDFRQNHLILISLKKSLERMTVVDYGIHPIPSESQREEWESQTINLITAFFSKNQLSHERISISVPREKVIARFISLPIAAKDNLRKVLEYEMPKYIPFDKEEVYFDYCLLKKETDAIHLLAVFVKKSELDPYLSLLKKIGIQPISIQIPSTAALNLFFFNGGAKESENSVLIDVTEPFLEMNLIQGKDWKESFHFSSPAEGRESKMIQRFNRSSLKGDSIPKPTFYIYGLGATEKMFPSLRETGQVQEVLPPPMSRLKWKSGESLPYKIYSSIGIPLKSLTRTPFDLNLLPAEMRKKKKEIGKPVFITLAFLTLVLCFTWVLGIFIRFDKGLKEVNSEVKKRRPEVEAVEKLQKQKEVLNKEILEFNKIKSAEVSKLVVLEEMTRLLPPAVWVWNVKYTGKEIEISGFADSASDLIPLLDKSPLFEKVEFSAPITKEKEKREGMEKERERFKIKMRLEGRGEKP